MPDVRRLSNAMLMTSCLFAASVTFCGIVCADEPAQQYEFVPVVDRWVGIYRGEHVLIGKLDSKGDFTGELKANIGSPQSGGTPPYVVLTTGKARKAYEFRSGALVPGTLSIEGFVPEVGGKIIPFSSYKYSPAGPPIWNLPGIFRPIAKKSAP